MAKLYLFPRSREPLMQAVIRWTARGYSFDSDRKGRIVIKPPQVTERKPISQER